MSPSHARRQPINAHIHERLAREDASRRRAFTDESLMSGVYPRGEKGLADNYTSGDVVVFRRP